MDTLTHGVTGVAVVSVATAIEPSIASHTPSFVLLLVAAIIASNIPDIDVIFSKNKKFLALHRGFTHGFPIAIGLTSLIAIGFAFPTIYHITWWKYVLILLGCVLIHLLMDITNHYGTQVLYPFSERWWAHSFISTFDPIIFIILSGYSALFWTQYNYHYSFLSWDKTLIIFATVLFVYYVFKFIFKSLIVIKLKNQYKRAHNVVIVTMVFPGFYRYVVETLDRFYIGETHWLSIHLRDTSEKYGPLDVDIVRLLNKSPEVKAFRYFSPAYKTRVISLNADEKMVTLTDLRYFTSKRHFPLQVRIKVNLKTNKVTPVHNGFQYRARTMYKKEILSLS